MFQLFILFIGNFFGYLQVQGWICQLLVVGLGLDLFFIIKIQYMGCIQKCIRRDTTTQPKYTSDNSSTAQSLIKIRTLLDEEDIQPLSKQSHKNTTHTSHTSHPPYSKYVYTHLYGKPDSLAMTKMPSEVVRSVFAAVRYVWVGRSKNLELETELRREMGEELMWVANVRELMEFCNKSKYVVVIICEYIYLQSISLTIPIKNNRIKLLICYNTKQQSLNSTQAPKITTITVTSSNPTEIITVVKNNQMQILGLGLEDEFLLTGVGLRPEEKEKYQLSYQLIGCMAVHETNRLELVEQMRYLAKLYAKDAISQQFIQQFVQNSKTRSPDQNQPLIQYTTIKFLQQIVKKLLLHSHSPTQLYIVQPFLQDLFNNVKRLFLKYKEQSIDDLRKMKCYKGGFLPERYLVSLCGNVGKVIRNVGFLSASKDVRLAQRRAKNVFFFIHVSSDCMKLSQGNGFADLDNTSLEQQQQQIIFNPMNRFKITKTQKTTTYTQIHLRYRPLHAKTKQQPQTLTLPQIMSNQLLPEEERFAYWQHYTKIAEQSNCQKQLSEGLFKLGNYHLKRNNFELSIEMFQRCRKLMEDIYGYNSIKNAKVLDMLGLAYFNTQKIQQSDLMFERSYYIQQNYIIKKPEKNSIFQEDEVQQQLYISQQQQEPQVLPGQLINNSTTADNTDISAHSPRTQPNRQNTQPLPPKIQQKPYQYINQLHPELTTIIKSSQPAKVQDLTNVINFRKISFKKFQKIITSYNKVVVLAILMYMYQRKMKIKQEEPKNHHVFANYSVEKNKELQADLALGKFLLSSELFRKVCEFLRDRNGGQICFNFDQYFHDTIKSMKNTSKFHNSKKLLEYKLEQYQKYYHNKQKILEYSQKLLGLGIMQQLLGNESNAYEFYFQCKNVLHRNQDKNNISYDNFRLNGYQLMCLLKIGEEGARSDRSDDGLSGFKAKEIDKAMVYDLVGKLGDFYYHAKNYQRSIQCFERCVKLCQGNFGKNCKQNIPHLLTLSTIHETLVQYYPAINYLQQSLNSMKNQQCQQNLQILRHMGTLYERIGHYTMAIDVYQRCMEIERRLGLVRGEGQGEVMLQGLGTNQYYQPTIKYMVNLYQKLNSFVFYL